MALLATSGPPQNHPFSEGVFFEGGSQLTDVYAFRAHSAPQNKKHVQNRHLGKNEKSMFSESSKTLKRLYIKHLSDFRSTSKTIKKVSFFVPKCTFLRNSKIAETIIYVTFERFFVSKIGTSQTFEKVDFGSLTSSQMLIFKAPGDFSTFSKTTDRGTKRGAKGPPWTPQDALQNRHRNSRSAQTLIYKLFWHPRAYPKIELENSGRSKRAEISIFKKMPKVPFLDPPSALRSDLTIFSVSATFGPSGRPHRGPESDRSGRQAGQTEGHRSKLGK